MNAVARGALLCLGRGGTRGSDAELPQQLPHTEEGAQDRTGIRVVDRALLPTRDLDVERLRDRDQQGGRGVAVAGREIAAEAGEQSFERSQQAVRIGGLARCSERGCVEQGAECLQRLG